MNRVKVLSALAALTVAGAFASSTTPAMAYTNFSVSFNVLNKDQTYSMIRQTSPLPNGVTGLIDPASAISPGGSDPASGSGTYSLAYPAVGSFNQVSLQYAKLDGTSACTFTIKVTRNSNSSFTLHLSSDSPTRCPVPGDVTNNNGQFTTVSSLTWASS